MFVRSMVVPVGLVLVFLEGDTGRYGHCYSKVKCSKANSMIIIRNTNDTIPN